LKTVHVLSGTVSGYQYVGGVVGRVLNYGMLYECSNAAAIIGNTYVGGVAGECDGASTTTPTVEACYNSGKVMGGRIPAGL
jgi:hypothetical protein